VYEISSSLFLQDGGAGVIGIIQHKSADNEKEIDALETRGQQRQMKKKDQEGGYKTEGLYGREDH
jgi:hypothetical protein